MPNGVELGGKKKTKHSNVNFEFRITVWVKKRTEEFDSGSD